MKRLRHGFTLVELLVVIAIIAILVLLLLPAINAMRESARRTQCINRMSQLIVGVHSHEMAHGYYPSGVKDPAGPIVSQEQGFHQSWTIPLLPYIEEDNVARMIDHKQSVYAKINRPVRNLYVAAFICPSSPMLMDAIGHSNYAGVQNDVEAPINANNNGVFFLNSRISQDDVTDGTRYTFFLGEKILQRGDLGWMSGTRATLRNTGLPINTTDRDPIGTRALSQAFLDRQSPTADEEGAEQDDVLVSVQDDAGGSDVAAADQPSEEESSHDGPATESDDGQLQDDKDRLPSDDESSNEAEIEEAQVDEQVTTDQPLSEADIDVGTVKETGQQDPWAAAKKAGLFVGGFGSFHKGGSVFAFGDGHIRFIDNEIDFKVYQHMGGRADGQVIDGRLFQ